MSSKKTTKKRSKKVGGTADRIISAQHHVNNNGSMLTASDEDTIEINFTEATHPKPVRLNPESEEEREKRLAKRKALTLRIFQAAYENHHKRKAS